MQIFYTKTSKEDIGIFFKRRFFFKIEYNILNCFEKLEGLIN